MPGEASITFFRKPSHLLFLYFSYDTPCRYPLGIIELKKKKETVGFFWQCNTLWELVSPDSCLPWAPYSDKALPLGLYPALKTSRNVRGGLYLTAKTNRNAFGNPVWTVRMLLELSNTSSRCEEPPQYIWLNGRGPTMVVPTNVPILYRFGVE